LPVIGVGVILTLASPTAASRAHQPVRAGGRCSSGSNIRR